MPTLSQRLGSFPTESRAEISPHCRRDYPLPPPINIGWVYGLREEKIESKVDKKPTSYPVFFFFCNKSLSLHSLHRALSDSKPRCHQLIFHPLHHTYSSPPKAPPFSSTAAAAHQHHHFRFLPSPVINSDNRSSQRRHRNHQLNLLITAETPSSSELLLRRPPFLQPFRLPAEREPTVHVLHIINFGVGWTCSGPAQVIGLVRPTPLKEPVLWGRFRPNPVGLGPII